MIVLYIAIIDFDICILSNAIHIKVANTPSEGNLMEHCQYMYRAKHEIWLYHSLRTLIFNSRKFNFVCSVLTRISYTHTLVYTHINWFQLVMMPLSMREPAFVLQPSSSL